MIGTFVLIILFGGNAQQSVGGFASVVQEFNSLQQCEYVRQSIISQHNSVRPYLTVSASGCFQK